MNMQDTFDADMAAIMADSTGFAEQVTLLPFVPQNLLDGHASEAPPTPTPISLPAFFDHAAQEVQPGSRQPVITQRPVLTLRVADMGKLARKLTRGDRFVVRGKSYRVEHPQYDGLGMVTVKLLEADSA